MFIQRKWREHRLYREIFSSLAQHEQLPSFLEKSNSKQLNISNGPKSAEKATKHTTQIESAQIGTTPFSIEKEEERVKEERMREESEQREWRERDIRETRLNNDAYLDTREEERRSSSSK